jgi:antitoxin YefM
MIQGTTSATGTWSAPGGMTTQIQQSAGTAAGAIADQPLTSAAPTGPRTAAYSASAYLVGVLLALKPAQTTTYGYDARGNRTTVSPAGGSAVALTYDQANRLTAYGANATYRLGSPQEGAVTALTRRPPNRETQRWAKMTIMMVMAETLPLAEIKARLSEIVDRVEREHQRVVLTRNGRPAAVIMSPADLEALEDTLELLSDPDALKEIKAARADLARGRVVSADELRAKYLRR